MHAHDDRMRTRRERITGSCCCSRAALRGIGYLPTSRGLRIPLLPDLAPFVSGRQDLVHLIPKMRSLHGIKVRVDYPMIGPG